jgi:hypothetical protein
MSDSAALRLAVERYAREHGMGVEGAELMPVKALIGWLEAAERRAERERSDAAGVAATERTEDRTDGNEETLLDR